MSKSYLFRVYSLLIVSLLLSSSITAQYCTTTYGTGAACDDDYLIRVNLSNLDNTTGVDCSYGDYTGLAPAAVQPGVSYTMNITVGNTFTATDHVIVWIDWNQDQTFDNANGGNEKYSFGSQGGTGNKAFSSTVAVPAGASLGNTRMRVAVKYNSAPTPCGSGGNYGEAEDYTVNVCNASNGLTASGTASICGGTNTTLTLSGNTSGKTIIWQSSTDGVNYSDIPGATSSTYTASPTVSTYYRVKATQSGCSAVTNAVLVSVTQKPVVNAGADKTICEGETAQLNATTSGPESKSYSQSFTTAIPDNAGWINKTFNVAGLYPTTMNDAKTVSVASVCVDIDHTWNSDLQIQLVSPSGTAINLANGDGGTGDNFRNVCFKTGAAVAINAGGNQNFNGDYRPRQPFSNLNGNNVNGTWTIRAQDNVGGTTGTWRSASITFNTGAVYTWTPSASLSASDITNPVASPSTTTTYTLKMENSPTCFTTDNVKVTVNPKPVTSNISGDNALCQGLSRNYSVSNTAGNTYAWTLTGGGTITSGQGTSTATVKWNSAGTWTVKLVETTALGCSGDEKTFNVTVYEAPTVNAGADRTICTGNTVSLGGSPTATGGSGNFTYSWTPNTALSSASVANPNANPNSTRTYNLTVTDNTSGCSTSDQVKITVVSPVVASAGTDKTICERDNVQIGGSPSASGGSGDYSYAWSPATGLNNTTIANPTSSVTTTTTYTLLVTDNQSNCTDSKTVKVNVNPAPTGSISSNTPQCDGFDANFSLAANSNDGGSSMSFAWTGVNSWTSTVQNPTRNDPYPAMNGNHSVVITNDVTGCTSVPYNHNFVQRDRPSALPFSVDPVQAQYCIGDDITFETEVPGGFLDPNWTSLTLGGPNGVIQTVANDKGVITFNPITLGTGDGGKYWVVGVQNATTCITDSAFIDIVVFETGGFSATNNGPVCVGSTINLSVTNGGAGINYSWTGPDGFTSNARTPSISGATAAKAGSYTVAVSNGSCPPFNVSTNVQVDTPRNPGSNGSATICENQNNFDLATALGSSPEASGTWTDDSNTGALSGASFDASAAGPGTYNFTHTLTTNNTCPDQSATVTITVVAMPKAGSNGFATICNDEDALDLFALLGPDAETGGTWNNISSVGSLNQNIWDATGVSAGTYNFEYTVSKAAECPSAKAIVAVTVVEEPNAGSSNTIEVCNTDGLVTLFDQLQGTPETGGSWTNLDNAIGFSGNSFDPSAGDAQNQYRFTYTVSNATCGDRSATVTVNLTEAPDAGTAKSLVACNSESSLNLFNGLDNPDLGGTWTNVSGAGVLTGSNWDATGVAAGDYFFDYTVSSGNVVCPDQTERVTVTIIEELNPGEDNSITLCENAGSIVLFNQLGGSPDPSGAWTDLSNTAGFDGANFDTEDGDGPGTYVFRYAVSAPSCPTKTADVSITVIGLPNAGDDAEKTICNDENAENLFTLLGSSAESGGTWNNESNVGTLNGDLWDATGVAAGSYFFTYTVNDASANCPSDDARVKINVDSPSNAGSDNSIALCEDETSVVLINNLAGSPETGGTWTDLSNTAGFDGSNFDPQAGDGPGTYSFKYSVSNNTCPEQTANLDITLIKLPHAGSGNNIDACNTQNAVNLTAGLSDNPDADGSWTNNSGLGTLSGSNWDPRGVSAGSYTFTYTVSDAQGLCPSDQTTVTVTLTEAESAGLDASINQCIDGATINLIEHLGGSPSSSGTWTNLNGALGYTNGTFNPQGGDLPGTYLFRYEITSATCPSSVAELTVNLIEKPNAGEDASADICHTIDNVDLYSLLGGTPHTGGSWDNLSGSGVLTGSNWDPRGLSAGTYSFEYTVSDATGACASDKSRLDIALKEQQSAGDNTTLVVCNSTVVDLFTSLNGNPDVGGVWTTGSDGLGAVVNPAEFDANGMAAGNYFFRYDLSSESPCLADFAVLEIGVQEQPSAGTSSNFDICEGASSANLYNQLGGNPSSGGTWTNPIGQNHSGSFNPAVDQPGRYTYNIDAPSACTDVSSFVDVTINQAPVITSYTEDCEPNNLDYRVTVTLSGGQVSSYTVNASYDKGAGSVAISGTWSGSTFISDLIPSKATYTFAFDDGFACGPVVLSNYFECGCASAAGDMESSLVEVCEGFTLNAAYDDAKEIRDENDGLNFILHESDDPGAFGTIYKVNQGSATFSIQPGMILDQIYYISAVVGNESGGVVDLSDGCLSISNRTPVRFNSNPDLTAGPDQDLCEGDSRLLSYSFIGFNEDFTLDFSDGSKETGLNGVNNTVSRSPASTTTYTVTKITDAKGCFRDVNEQTTLTVIPRPDLAMGGDISFCEGTNHPILTFTENNPGVSPYQVTFYDPDSDLDITFNTADSTVVNMPFTGPGTFTYQLLTVVDASSQSCSSSPNTTVTVEVYANPTVSFSNDITICEGASGDVVLTMNAGQAPFSISYNDGVNPPVVDSPVFDNPKTYSFAPTVSTTYSFTNITDNRGCSTDLSDQVNFTVNPLPVLNSFTTDNAELCSGDVANLLFDISGNGDFEVDYELDGVLNQITVDGSTSIPVTHTRPVGSNSSAVYNYKIIAISDNSQPVNCMATGFSDEINIEVYPTPTGSISFADSPICENSQATLNFAFTGVDKFDYTYEEVVQGTSPIVATGTSPQISFTPRPNETDFKFRLVEVTATAPSGFTCSATINQEADLSVQLLPHVTVDGLDSLCAGDTRPIVYNISRTEWPVSVTLNSNVSGAQSPVSGLSDGDSSPISPAQTSNYSIINVQDDSPLACKGTFSGSKHFEVISLPQANLSADVLEVCEGNLVNLIFDLTDGLNGYKVDYSINGQLKSYSTSKSPTKDSLRFNPVQTTDYRLISVTDLSNYACRSDIGQELQVTVVEKPIAAFNFSPDNPTVVNPEVSFYNYSQYADQYSWKVDGQEISNFENFTNTFPSVEEGEYVVWLIARNGNDATCVDSTWRVVKIKGMLFVHVPNTFTPNGDGNNETFKPVTDLLDPDHYLFEVYNRWGNRVFSTTSPTAAWDGFYEGKKVQEGMYAWKLIIKSKTDVIKTETVGSVRVLY